MTRATLINYLSHYHSPERMVVAGVGVDHHELVEVAQVSNIIVYHFLKFKTSFILGLNHIP